MGFGRARTECGDGHACVADFFGDGLGEGEDVRFARVVGGEERAGLECGGGSDVEDAASFFGEHVREKKPSERGKRGDVDLDEVEVLLDGNLIESAACAEAGVVDEDVDL